MKFDYNKKMDIFIVEYNGTKYAFDGVDDYVVTPRGFELIDDLPVPVKTLKRVLLKARFEHIVERDIMIRRRMNFRLLPSDLPTSVTVEQYRKFLAMADSELLPSGFLEELGKVEIDPVHALIGSYFTAYANIRGNGPYAVFDPQRAVYDAWVAVKRYSENGKVLPVGWWTKLYTNNYTGNSSFTVFGVLHSPNHGHGVWLLGYHRERDENDVRVVHSAFLETIKEFGQIDFNKEVKKLENQRFSTIKEFVEKEVYERVYNGFLERADLEIFDEIMLPPEFQTPVNYTLLTKYNIIAVPSLDLKSRLVTPKNVRKYLPVIKKKFEVLL